MTSQLPAAAYMRTYSGDRSDTWNVENQEKQINEYANRNGYDVVRVYQDITLNGNDKLPGLERLLFDAQSGLFSDVLVVDASRLFHNTALARRYTNELRSKLGVEIIFVHGQAINPTGLPIQTLDDLFDEYTRYEHRMRTTLGKQARAQRGLFNGTLPFGYTLDENGVPVPHPADSIGLVMAFNAYSTGEYSDAQVAALLNQSGYHTTGNWGQRPFTKDTVNRILQNPFYLGQIKYKGETLPGQQPALIDQELYDHCQAIRAQRARKPKNSTTQKRVYVLAGIARCSECELTLRSSSTQTGGGRRYYRHTAHERGYECSVPDRMLQADVLEQQWLDILSTVLVPGEWQQRLQGKVVNTIGPFGVDLTAMWSAATLEQQRSVTQLLLKALYIDISQGKIVAVAPQPGIEAMFVDPCQALGVAVR